MCDSLTGIDYCADTTLCSEKCTNVPGSYKCSCSAGKFLSNDQSTCLKCPFGYWGVNCANKCNCQNAVSCDAVTGCVCQLGFNGTFCELPVDLCPGKLFFSFFLI